MGFMRLRGHLGDGLTDGSVLNHLGCTNLARHMGCIGKTMRPHWDVYLEDPSLPAPLLGVRLNLVRGFDWTNHGDLDPRDWFGQLVTRYPVMPLNLEDVLVETILLAAQQHALHKMEPFHISMFGRAECELPTNWHTGLVRRLLDAGIWVDDHGICWDLHHPHLFGVGRDAHGRKYLGL